MVAARAVAVTRVRLTLVDVDLAPHTWLFAKRAAQTASPSQTDKVEQICDSLPSSMKLSFCNTVARANCENLQQINHPTSTKAHDRRPTMRGIQACFTLEARCTKSLFLINCTGLLQRRDTEKAMRKVQNVGVGLRLNFSLRSV